VTTVAASGVERAVGGGMTPPKRVVPKGVVRKAAATGAKPRSKRGTGTRAKAPARKRPFRFELVLTRIRERLAALGVADAAMFALADAGHGSVFAQLVACVISIRTLDELSLPAAMRLLDRAPTARAMARLSLGAIDKLIGTSTFHETKARTIAAIARRTVAEHGGELPCDFEILTSFKGVGPKCANLALGIACRQARISVDIHVHRVTNRWGVVHTRSPEQTMVALEGILPREHWIEINRLLVPFGKHVCTGMRPRCSACPVLAWCRQVGVTSHR
jgi:endonuclease-3